MHFSLSPLYRGVLEENVAINVNPRLPRMLYPSFITQSCTVCKGKPSVQTLQLFLTISDSSLRMLKDGQNCFVVLQKKWSFANFSICNFNETVSGMLLMIQLRAIFGTPFTFKLAACPSWKCWSDFFLQNLQRLAVKNPVWFSIPIGQSGYEHPWWLHDDIKIS